MELFLRFREKSIAKSDVQCMIDSNVNQLFGRRAEDLLKVRFFNGCFIDNGIMVSDQDLGYLNIPNVEGYSVRVYGRNNFVLKKPFDLSVFARNGLRTEVASFRINNVGNRGPEMAEIKPPETARIVFLGDSITFGYYVEENQTFAVLTGKGLAQFVPRNCQVEVVNAGVSSLNERHIYNHLIQRALSWSPDLVIWNFYVNDILDTGGQEADVLFPVRRLRAMSFLTKTALGRFIGSHIFSSRIGANIGIDYGDPTNRLVEDSWKVIEADLVRAHELLRQRNIPFVVTIFPSAIQFSRPWTALHYQERLKNICARDNIGCIDFLPAFEKAGPAARLYFSGDSIHPNALGHAIAARTIISYLEKHPDILKRLSNRDFRYK